MLRFIDLTKCDPDEFDDNDFAFFNTVTNTFINIAEEQVWNSKQEFIDWYNECQERVFMSDSFFQTFPLNRFLSLIPDDHK